LQVQVWAGHDFGVEIIRGRTRDADANSATSAVVMAGDAVKRSGLQESWLE
jgi:hypothetical protein